MGHWSCDPNLHSFPSESKLLWENSSKSKMASFYRPSSPACHSGPPRSSLKLSATLASKAPMALDCSCTFPPSSQPPQRPTPCRWSHPGPSVIRGYFHFTHFISHPLTVLPVSSQTLYQSTLHWHWLSRLGLTAELRPGQGINACTVIVVIKNRL